MAARLRDINPAIVLNPVNDFIKDEKTSLLLEQGNFDYVVDCIDTLSSKVFFNKSLYRPQYTRGKFFGSRREN